MNNWDDSYVVFLKTFVAQRALSGLIPKMFNFHVTTHSVMQRFISTQPTPGPGMTNTLSCLSQIFQKQRHFTSLFPVHLFIHLFRTSCENFRPRSLKVRSPGHVKWPHLRKSPNSRHNYTDWPIAWKKSTIDIFMRSYTLSLSKAYLGMLISVTYGQVNFAASQLYLKETVQLRKICIF